MQLAKKVCPYKPPEGFRVTTVGSGAPPFDPNRGAPCTMVQYKDKTFLVDMGYGAYKTIGQAGINPADITNICFTHLHSDHSLDYGYYLITGWHDGRDRLHVIGPDGIKKIHSLYLEMYDGDISYRANLGISMKGITENVIFDTVKGGETLEVDGVKITTCFVPHTAYTVAYRFEADGKAVVVSGDLKYSEDFISFAKGADIIVFDGNQAKSTFINERGPSFVANLDKSHATISEIAQMAKKSEAKSIVITHLTTETYIGELIKAAAEYYNGEVIPAEDMLSIDIL